mgnify:CR=1 FL=1
MYAVFLGGFAPYNPLILGGFVRAPPTFLGGEAPYNPLILGGCSPYIFRGLHPLQPPHFGGVRKGSPYIFRG